MEWASVEPSFRAHLLTHRHKTTTAKTYAANIRVFVHWCNSHEIDYIRAEPDWINLYLGERMEKRAHNTVALQLVAMRVFYEFCIRQGWRMSNPCKDMSIKWEEPDPRKPLSTADQLRLLTACRNQRDRDMISLALDVGLRVSEVVSIHEEQIDFETGFIYFRGKGGKIGWAKPSPDMLDRLSCYCGKKGGVLWWTRDGRPLNVKRAQRNMEEIAKRAGVKVHWHKLRTTFANEALRAGVALEDLQLLMRHKDIATTRHYAGFAINERAQRAIDRLHSERRLFGNESAAGG